MPLDVLLVKHSIVLNGFVQKVFLAVIFLVQIMVTSVRSTYHISKIFNNVRNIE